MTSKPEDSLSDQAKVPSDEERAAFERERSERSLRATISDLKASNKRLHKELDLAERRTDMAIRIAEPVDPKPITQRKKRGGEATAVWIASDWHVGETVLESQVAGRNSYNMDVARARAERFFQSAVKLLHKEQRDIRIETGMLAIIGDIVTGTIHPDIAESHQTTQMGEVRYAKELLVVGIDFILKNTDLKRLLIPCCFGNHGRTTMKPRISTAAGYNLEWLMYHSLADIYRARGEKRVEFVVTSGEHLYIDVYSQVIRFHHGDSIPYYGGVSGLTLPMTKAIKNWDTFKRADQTVIGHYHQLLFGPDFVCNGSNLGYSAYALHVKARFEKPQQAFFLMDSRKGRTVMCPIDVEGEE